MRSIDVRQAPQTINKMSMRETPTTRRKKRRKMTDGIQIKMARNQRKQQKFLHKMLTFAMLIVLVKTTHQISLPVAASAPQKAPFAGLLGGTNLPDSDRLLVFRALPLSARNALAFFDSHAHQEQPADPPGQQANNNNNHKCQRTSRLSGDLFGGQLWAVEGANLKLNFAISGHRLGAQTSGSLGANPKLHVHWTRDGGARLASLNSDTTTGARGPSERVSSVQLVEESERETIKHLLGLGAPELPVLAHSNQSSSTYSQDDLWRSDLFVLVPFVDQQQLDRLEPNNANPQLPLAVRQTIQQLAAKSKQVSSSPADFQPDQFVNDGSSIDWHRLAAHLAHTMRPNHKDECRASVDNIEHLLLVQLQFSQLNVRDRGQYELNVCQQQRSTAASDGPKSTSEPFCAHLGSFSLHVVEDWPRFESHFGPQLVSVDERLSIKCEASGFTLPQISWYLDGQLISESAHNSHHRQGRHQAGKKAPSDTATNLDDSQLMADHQEPFNSMPTPPPTPLLVLGNSFKIGDYVSQDNHVHSFINSSSVRLGDGGVYRCQANNGLHQIEHEARLDVRGPANIERQLPANLSALIGSQRLQIQCPYSGHPVGPVEWYFRPASGEPGDTGLIGRRSARSSGDFSFWRPPSRRPVQTAPTADEPEQPDPDKDEWLSQAAAMTASPAPEDYPEGLPDYPVPAVQAQNSLLDSPAGQAYESLGWPEVDTNGRQQFGQVSGADYDNDDDLLADYSMFDYVRGPSSRRKRQASPSVEWIKLPQSRRHQVLANGTLVIHEIWHQDRGLYRCKVHPADSAMEQAQAQFGPLSTSSNELQLNVLIPPVISPFSSAELLREGMRNLLTCSAIEGDPPIRLRWLKDGRPIEEHIQQVASLSSSSSSSPSSASNGRQSNSNSAGNGWQSGANNHQARIRIENNNEYTSTLYFGHVEFGDNGNYTCMAANKAASVNYTTRMVVNVPPKWLKSPKDVDCVAGQNIHVDCQAEAHPSPRIWWEIGVDRTTGESTTINNNKAQQQQQQLTTQTPSSLGGYLHAPNHYRTIISNSRIHILENATLVIRDVGKQDEGFYLCQAANKFGLLSSLVKLTVNVGASFSSKFAIKYVKLNEKIELDCDPSGQSPVTLTWFMRTNNGNANSLASTNSSGSTRPAELTSPLNNNQQLGRRLFTGQIQTTIPTEHAAQAQSRQLANQIDDPEYNHKHKVVEIDSSISFELIPATKLAPNEIVRLHLKQAKRTHSAEFICLAQNQFGADEKVIRLLVQEAPDPVEDISVVQVDSRSVSLAWSQPFNGNSPIISYTIEWRPTVSQVIPGEADDEQQTKWSHLVVQQPAVTLSSLQPMTSYEIRVRAQNSFGYSQVSPSGGSRGAIGQGSGTSSGQQPLIVTTNEEAPAAPPSEIRALPLSSTSIQVTWAPPPNHNKQSYSIKGYYLGYKATAAAAASPTAPTSSLSNANESFIFKTVSLFPSSETNQLQIVDSYTNNNLFHKSNQTNDKHAIRVVIGDLKRSTKYSIIVQAFNSAGPGPQSDLIEARTLVNDPPPAPQLRIGTTTYTSLELQWSFYSSLMAMPATHSNLYNLIPSEQVDKSTPPSSEHQQSSDSSSPLTIDGYHLFYRLATAGNQQQWQEKKLTQETHMMVSISPMQPGGSSLMMNNARSELTIVELPGTNKSVSLSSRQRPHNLPATNTSFSSPTPPNRANYRFVLDQLSCGQAYQVYLVAFNSYGFGLPSDILRSKTRGGQPIAPRRQDFMTINSTFVQLNLDAWLDAGCPISNFEIKYKQLSGGRSEAASILASGGTGSGSATSKQTWLLLSSNINPDEQRTIELRDLQAENWYAIQASAESSAGRTSQSYAFMTLDKFNQQTSEATELYASLGNTGGGGGLPALFRSTSNPFKSIWFGNNGGQLGGTQNQGLIMTISPILISACLCLILFASCSLFLIKRYNSLVKSSTNTTPPSGLGDTTSLDSRTGNLRHRHHHQQRFVSSSMKNSEGNYVRPSTSPPSSSVSLSGSPSNNNGVNFANSQAVNECYSMKTSPCKTGSTILTSNNTTSGSSTGGSSALLLGPNKMTFNCTNAAPLCGSHNNNNMIYGPQFNEMNSCGYNGLAMDPNLNKFATLAHRVGADSNEQQLMMNQPFKTLQHHNNGAQARPASSTSTFLPNQQVCNQAAPSNYQMAAVAAAVAAEQQQQIYSKLRLIQQFNMTNETCGQVAATGELCSKQIIDQSEALNDYNQGAADLNQINSQQQVQHAQSCQNSNCQQLQPQTNNQLNDQQDDYALPFPPKWV